MATNPTNYVAGRLDTGVTLRASGLTRGAAGDVIPTNQGLAYLITERGTKDGPNAVGVAQDEAIVRLAPTPIVVELPVTGSVGEAVYVTTTAAVTYKTQAGNDLTGNHAHVGHIVTVPNRTPATNNAFVHLGTATGKPGIKDN